MYQWVTADNVRWIIRPLVDSGGCVADLWNSNGSLVHSTSSDCASILGTSVTFTGLNRKLDGTLRAAPPAVTLTFDLLTLKYNQHVYESQYTKIGWSSLCWFLSSQGFFGRTDSLSHRLSHGLTCRNTERPRHCSNGGGA